MLISKRKHSFLSIYFIEKLISTKLKHTKLLRVNVIRYKPSPRIFGNMHIIVMLFP